MTAMRWRLLGFDARENAEDCRKTPIDDSLRHEFLLRPEVTCPFSVDKHVWPTHFLYHPEIGHLVKQRHPPLIEADADCSGGLWLNLAKMRERLLANKRDAILISVELLALESTSLNDFPSPLIYTQTTPNSLPESSVFLGYDVADVGFLSGLSNCGYTPAELVELRPTWSKRINDFGLLQLENDALDFKEISDTRASEHTPFWVYRLHSLPAI
jgi:hypothetical protein